MMKFAVVLLVLMTSCTPAYEPPVEPGFAEGKKLIEANCADCAGATKEGLQRGIDVMRDALDTGYVDRAAGLRLLAQAYNELALVYSEPDSVEHGQALARRRAVLEQLVAFAPGDPGVHYEYVMTFSDRDQRILSLREILAVHSDHEPTRFGLAMSLAERQGSEAEAAGLLKGLVESAEAERAVTYATRLHEVLLKLGRKTEAEDLARRFNLFRSTR
jgi:hypothetical protein